MSARVGPDGRSQTRASKRRRGLHGEVVEIIGHRIVSGELSEGATINVNALEEELGHAWWASDHRVAAGRPSAQAHRLTAARRRVRAPELPLAVEV